MKDRNEEQSVIYISVSLKLAYQTEAAKININSKINNINSQRPTWLRKKHPLKQASKLAYNWATCWGRPDAQKCWERNHIEEKENDLIGLALMVPSTLTDNF